MIETQITPTEILAIEDGKVCNHPTQKTQSQGVGWITGAKVQKRYEIGKFIERFFDIFAKMV